MEKENTTKTAGEGKEDSTLGGCGCGGDMPIREEKTSAFMGSGCGCMPEEMSKMLEDCCGSGSFPEGMKEKMKGFYQGKSQKA
ncbi:MAG: hypothetical protein WB588_05345 [Dehalococcoidia bacterium]